MYRTLFILVIHLTYASHILSSYAYSVKTDSDHAEHIYESLTQAGFKVWWDKACLEPGTSWEEGYVT